MGQRGGQAEDMAACGGSLKNGCMCGGGALRCVPDVTLAHDADAKEEPPDQQGLNKL